MSSSSLLHWTRGSALTPVLLIALLCSIVAIIATFQIMDKASSMPTFPTRTRLEAATTMGFHPIMTMQIAPSISLAMSKWKLQLIPSRIAAGLIAAIMKSVTSVPGLSEQSFWTGTRQTFNGMVTTALRSKNGVMALTVVHWCIVIGAILVGVLHIHT